MFVIILLELENLGIDIHEVSKQKPQINGIDYIIWKLPKELFIFLTIQKVVFVIDPSIVKVLFNLIFEFLFDELTSVEGLQNSEESG